MKKVRDVKREDVLRDAKDKQPRKNFTFRMDAELIKRFMKACKDEEVAASRILEEYIRHFLGEK